ncbi:MAG: alpha/beta hydrolase [Cohaesibacteraceae bacterium]|nr:alpha/beta hydrolase [Cohaesibacteraceae bacterium]
METENGLVRFSGTSNNLLQGEFFGTNGQVVVLLHGGGQTRHSWDNTARKLASFGATAIIVDQRGHGQSEWSTNGHYSFFDFAGDATAVFQQVYEKYNVKPIAIGASLGGISSLLAEGNSSENLLSGLVLVDITPRIDPRGVAKITGFMKSNMKDGFATVEEAADVIAAYLPLRKRPKSLDGLKKNLRRHSDGRYRWHWDPGFISGPNSVQSRGEEVQHMLKQAALSLTIPTLLIRGGQSELVSEEHAREFLDLVPHATLKDIHEAGHMVAGDRNDVFSDAVLDFITRH